MDLLDYSIESRGCTVRYKILLGGFILLVILLFLPMRTFAIERPFATQQEVMKSKMKYLDLPDYCQQKLLERDVYLVLRKQLPQPYKSASDAWRAKIGERNWIYFHHYCWGIQKSKNSIKYLGGGKSDMYKYVGMLNSAKQEFLFMKNRADEKFPLWNQLRNYEKIIDQSLRSANMYR